MEKSSLFVDGYKDSVKLEGEELMLLVITSLTV